MSEHTLPSNATDLEVALDVGLEKPVLGIPVPIREAFRPYETPSQVLPFLAWERSVDIWDPKWSETKKRAVTARSLVLHKHKGTAYAIKEYVRYVGGNVTKIFAPPQKVFSGASLTREEREAWLSRLPQVRVWQLREGGTAPEAKSFYGGQALKVFTIAKRFLLPSTALERMRRRARYVVNGQETDTTVSDFGNYFRLHLKSPAGSRVFTDVKPARRFWISSDAWRRLVSIEPTPRLPWRSSVGPTLQAVTSEPDLVRVNGTVGCSVFPGFAPLRRFFVPTTAPLRLFERYAVDDGSKQRKRPAINFMGLGRYGWPAHTAEISASVPGTMPKWAAGAGVVLPRTRFWRPSNARERVETVCGAIRAAARLTDRIFLRTGPTPKFVIGRPFFIGADNYIFGQP